MEQGVDSDPLPPDEELEGESNTLPVVHVYPLFGPAHVCVSGLQCWCYPDYELACVGVIVIHHQMH